MSLTLNPMLMLLVFCVFISLIFLLNIWLYKPILRLLQKRDLMLNEDSNTLADLRIEIEEVKNQIQKTMHEAREQASRIKEEAIKTAQNDYDERFERAKSELEARFLQSMKEVSEKQEKINSELSKQIPVFSKTLQEKINSLGALQ